MIDEFLLCDDLGLNVLAIEHHAGINSLIERQPDDARHPRARRRARSRILSLGTLVSLRHDPVRIAEEYATADVISRGRLEIGFVKSGGSEMASANANPVGNVERYWEAIDLITKALSTQDGPFSWEGQAFHPSPREYLAAAVAAAASAHVVRRRAIPRPPPRSGGAAWCRCWCCAGPEGTKRAYAAHRKARVEAGLPKVTTDNFAYAALCLCRRHRRGGRARSAASSCGSSTPASNRRRNIRSSCPARCRRSFAPQVYRTAPRRRSLASAEKGVAPAGVNAAALIAITPEQAMAQGILFAGNPDSVYRQIMAFYDKVGGFGHLTLIGRSGFMTHAESEKGIRLFAKEVLPRLREIKPVTAE